MIPFPHASRNQGYRFFNDLQRLRDSYPHVSCFEIAKNFVDLGDLAHRITKALEVLKLAPPSPSSSAKAAFADFTKLELGRGYDLTREAYPLDQPHPLSLAELCKAHLGREGCFSVSLFPPLLPPLWNLVSSPI